MEYLQGIDISDSREMLVPHANFGFSSFFWAVDCSEWNLSCGSDFVAEVQNLKVWNFWISDREMGPYQQLRNFKLSEFLPPLRDLDVRP